MLNAIEVRILGALVEKERTTPDYYPLSLNSLTLACNQSTNRDPVMQLDEAVVIDSVARLREKSLIRATRGIDSRITKYSHLLAERMNFDARELAVMCVLMLRGPQTAGELKTRTARLADFDSLADIDATLTALMAREPSPPVTALPRRTGQKEVRYAHLLSGDVSAETAETPPPPSTGSNNDRILLLEAAVSELRGELLDVRRQLDEFRRQFE